MAELYIIDALVDPVDITTFTEAQKKQFFKDHPEARPTRKEDVIEEVKTDDSVKGAGALSNEAQPMSSVSELDLGSLEPESTKDLQGKDIAKPLFSSIDELKNYKPAEASESSVNEYKDSVRVNQETIESLRLETEEIDFTPQERIVDIGDKFGQVLVPEIYTPYAVERKQAKAQLKENGQDLTPENIDDVTRGIILKDKLNIIKKSKAFNYLNDLTEKEIEELYRAKETDSKELGDLKKQWAVYDGQVDKQMLGQTNALKKLEELNKKFTDKDFKFDISNEEETVTLQNGKTVPATLFSEYEEIIQATVDNSKFLQNEGLRLVAKTNEASEINSDLDLLSRNYSVIDKMQANFVHGFSDAYMSGQAMAIDAVKAKNDLVISLASKIALGNNAGSAFVEASRKQGVDYANVLGKVQMYGFDVNKEKDIINDYRKKSNEKYAKDFYYAADFSTEINPFGKNFSVSRLGEYAAVSLSGQGATMAQLVTPGGIYMLGATSYGRTISDIEIADKESGTTTGNFQKRMTAIGYASAEVVLGTMPTLRLLGKSKEAFNATTIREFTKGAGQYFATQWDVIPMSFATEYVSEGSTQFVQNVIDMVNGNKKPSQLMEGVGEAAFTGGLLGPMISGAPFIKGMVLSHFSDWQSYDEFRSNAASIKELNSQADAMDKRTTEYKDKIKLINKFTNENADILNKLEDNILDNLTSTGATLYQKASEDQETIRLEAQSIINGADFDGKVKQLKKLKAQFDANESARSLFKQDFNIQFNIETSNVQEDYRSKAAKELGLVQGIDSNKAIENKAIELYNVDKIEKANNRGFEAMMKLKKSGIGMNYGVEKDNVKLLSKLKIDLDGALENESISKEQYDKLWKDFQEDIKSGATNGVNFNYIDATTGKRVYNIYVSEANALKNGKTQTAVHEIGHTIFIEGLSTDPEAYSEMADGIKAYLKENNSSAYNRIIGNTLGQNADEVLTNFLEEVSSGRLELEADRKSKDWTSIFGFSLSSVLNKQAKIDKAVEFDNVTDIVSFLKTLGKKINDGTLTVSDVKTIQEKGLPKGVKPKTDKKVSVKKSQQVNTKEMSQVFDSIVVGKDIKSNREFVNSDGGRNLIKAFDVIDNNKQYNSYINGLITRDSNLGSLPSNVRENINREIKEGMQDRVLKNYDPFVNGSFQSLFSFVYGNAKGQGGRTQKTLLDVKKKYAKEIKTSSLTTEAGGNFDVADTSKGADELLDEKLKGRNKVRSKIGQGLTLRGKKLITIVDKVTNMSLVEEIETAALETFKGTMPDVDSKKYKDFVLNQESKIRKAIQSRSKSTPDFKQLLKEFLPLYKSYPLSTLVQMERNSENKVLIKEIKRNISPTEVDKAIAENKLPKNTNRLSGPTLYEHANPTNLQLENFFFGNDVNPSTKGTRKDAFFRGLATQLISDMAPEAARKAGKQELEITKMSSKLNVDPSIKFSEQINVTEDQLKLFIELSQLRNKDGVGRKLGFPTPTINEESRPGLVKKLLDNASFLSDITINGAAMASGGRKPFYGNSKNKYSSKKVAINNGIKEPTKYFKTTDGDYFKATDKKPGVNNWVPKVGKLFYGVKDPNYINLLKDAKKYTGKKPIKIDLKKLKGKRLNKQFIKENQPQVDANMVALDYMVNELNDAVKAGMPLEVAGMIVIQSYQATSGLIKIAAPFKYVSDTFEYGDKKDGELKYREEHNPPASVVGASIMYAIKTNTAKQVIKAIKNNYYQTQLSKKDDSKLDRAKLDGTLYQGTSIFNDPISRLAAAGIDLNTLKNPLTGETMAQEYGAGISNTLYNSFSPNEKIIISAYQNTEILKSVTDPNDNISENIKMYAKLVPDMSVTVNYSKRTFGPKLDGTNTTTEQIEILGKYDKAATLARSFSTPTKKIRVFDFDDTLAKTSSKVIVNTSDGETIKINATQFAQQAQTLEADGATFDFTEFEKVIDGEKGPLFDLAKTMSEADGKRDIFILTARPQASATAIKEFLDGVGLNIPLANITGLENGSPEAKANWVIDKASNGYNDFYFADDAIKNVKAVKEILSQIDVKSEVQLAKFSKQVDMDKVFNEMIERTTGIESFKEFSDSKAKRIGKNKGKYSFFIPPSAEDFAGLMYPLYGKGKQGDRDMRWINENIIGPFGRAENALTQARLSVANDYRALKNNFKTVPKTLKKEAFDGFTYSDALRVSIWTSQGMDVPGLSKSDIKQLNEFIDSNAELRVFASELVKIQKGKPYPEPTKDWLGGTITTDILGNINKVSRAEYLQEWQQNVDVLFSDKNKNKLRAAFGDNYVEALEDILRRMKSGSNRARSSSRIVNNVTDWINNSVGAIMFFNARSAVLQTLSAVNFINWSDNNILNAGVAFANQPQYWKDFMYLMNSDFLKARRNGLKINVSESEIADAVAESSNKPKAAIAYLLSKGFLPTQFADSFAIASGGATFYRNRIKKYMKEGMPQELAEQKAFIDFYDLAEETQQSSRTDRISQQQASTAGRVILAFANTPMQYARLQKKAFLDLKDGRGDAKTHISKIIYYGVIQNLIFNALQNALFAMAFDDDDTEDEAAKKAKAKSVRIANGMTDSLLRGLGIGGVAVATVKNIAVKLYDESEKKSPKYEDAALELLSFSPPIDSKVTKFRSALRTMSWNSEEIKEKGFSLDNPAYLAGGQVVSAFTNIPLDRVVKKYDNLSAAFKKDTETWQSIALIAGWSKWEVGIKSSFKKKSKSKSKSYKKTDKRRQ